MRNFEDRDGTVLAAGDDVMVVSYAFGYTRHDDVGRTGKVNRLGRDLVWVDLDEERQLQLSSRLLRKAEAGARPTVVLEGELSISHFEDEGGIEIDGKKLEWEIEEAGFPREGGYSPYETRFSGRYRLVLERIGE